MLMEQNDALALRSSRRWRLALWSGVILVLLAGALLASGSYLVQLAIQRWVHDAGLGEVTMDRVQFNPLIGALVLRNAILRKDGVQRLRVDEARIRIALRPLWQRRLVVREFKLGGFQTTLRRTDHGGYSLAGIEISAKPPPPAEGGAVWELGLDALVLERGAILIVLGGEALPLSISRFALTGVASWDREKAAALTFRGRLAQARLEIGGELSLFSPLPGATLKVKMDGLDLGAMMSAFNVKSPDLGGKLSTASELNISYAAGAVSVAQRGSLRVRAFSLEEGAVRLVQQDLKWQGHMQLDYRTDKGLSLTATGDLGMFDSQLALADGEMKGRLGELRIPSSTFTLSPSRILWRQEGEIGLAQLSATLEGAELHGESVQWHGRAVYENRLAAGKGVFDLAGELNAGAATLELAQTGMALAADALQWRGEFKGTREQPAGGGTGEAPMAAEIRGRLGAGQFHMSAFAGALEMSVANPLFEGELAQQEGLIGLSGRLMSDRASLNAPGAGYRLVGWRHLETGQVQSADLRRFELDWLSMAEARLAEPIAKDHNRPPPLARAVRTRVEGVRYASGQGVSVEGVLAQGLTLFVRRDVQGRWSPKQVQERIKSALNGIDIGGGQLEQPPFAIKQIHISGDSKVRLLDERVAPPYRETFALETLSLKDLDSQIPMQPSTLKGEVRIGAHSRIRLDADLYPFKRRPGARIVLDVSALEIPPLSTYGEALLGYSLDSGQMDSQVTLEVRDEQLDGLVKLQLHQLQVSPLESERRRQLDSELSVPLETALGLLRNEQNSITLELPISGHLDHPDFDLRDAINQATGKALEKGALAYLAATLQPFGALIAIASVVSEAASAVRLDPVAFAPGGLQWEGDVEHYLGKVSQVLKERPELRVRICGVAVDADREQLHQQKPGGAKMVVKGGKAVSISDDELLNLARARADKVKRYLVDRHKIKHGRLISCKPTFDADTQQPPRVDLLI